MKKIKIFWWSLINTLGILIYVLVVSWLIFSGEKIFGKMKNLWGPFALLLLLVLSAAIVGLLIFGQPICLYLKNSKKEAIKLLFFTIGLLFLFTIIILIVCAILL